MRFFFFFGCKDDFLVQVWDLFKLGWDCPSKSDVPSCMVSLLGSELDFLWLGFACKLGLVRIPVNVTIPTLS